MELRDTAKAADGHELAVTRFPAEGRARATLLLAGAMGPGLPAGVAWQWRRWGTHPEYLLSEGEGMRRRFDAVTAPVLGYSFEDDAIITKPAIDELHRFYRRALVEPRHVAPADARRGRIGHFGYFLPESRGNLWRDTLAWLRAKAAA